MAAAASIDVTAAIAALQPHELLNDSFRALCRVKGWPGRQRNELRRAFRSAQEELPEMALARQLWGKCRPAEGSRRPALGAQDMLEAARGLAGVQTIFAEEADTPVQVWSPAGLPQWVLASELGGTVLSSRVSEATAQGVSREHGGRRVWTPGQPGVQSVSVGAGPVLLLDRMAQGAGAALAGLAVPTRHVDGRFDDCAGLAVTR